MTRKTAFIIAFVTLTILVPVSAQEQGTLTIEGHIVQGSAGGPAIPADLPLQLQIYDASSSNLQTLPTVTSENGAIAFSDAPALPEGGYYVLSTAWAGITQNTLPLDLPEASQPVTFTVYELTDKSSEIVAHQGNLRIEFSGSESLGVQMLLELEYINLGDRIIINGVGTSQTESFTVELPVGAFGIAPEEAPGTVQRFEPISGSGDLPIPGIRDTQPLVPSWPNIMRASYFVPYEQSAVIDMRFPFAVTGFGIFVPDQVLSIESELFVPTTETITSSGKVYTVYEQTTPLKPNEPFKFVLKGARPASLADQQAGTSSSGSKISMFIVIIGAVMLLLTGLVIWLLNSKTSVQDKP